MHVLGTKRDVAGYSGPADVVHPPDALAELLPQADFVVLTCALTPATRGLINRETIGLMKRGVFLINVARGEVVVEEDLVQALRSGAIAGAGIDTFGPQVPMKSAKDIERPAAESPFWSMRNVIMTPDNAGGTPHFYDHLAEIIADNIRRFRNGQPLRNRVLPSTL
jgi:phosphoglycerate dehydrogenase-like enzyme